MIPLHGETKFFLCLVFSVFHLFLSTDLQAHENLQSSRGDDVFFLQRHDNHASKTLQIGGIKSQIYVILFFTADCNDCKITARMIAGLARDRRTRSAFEKNILRVDIGKDANEDAFRAWTSQQIFSNPVVADGAESESLATFLGVIRYPSVLILDCQLNVQFRFAGKFDAPARSQFMSALAHTQRYSCEP